MKKSRKTNYIIILLFLAAVIYCIGYWILHERNAYEQTSRLLLSDMAEELQNAYEEETTNHVYEDEFLPIQLSLGETADQKVKLYVGEENRCYVFLPAYADTNRLQWHFEAAYQVEFEGSKIQDGEWLQEIQLGRAYDLHFMQDTEDLSFQLIFMQSENLPAAFIRTQSETMSYVDEDKGNKEEGDFACILADGSIDSQSAMTYIKGRGNSSWGGEGSKNQYNMELSAGTDILKMGSAQSWVLQGNKLDASMIRNKLVYDFANDIGLEYAVDAQYADLYFNGEYAGVYLICEKVEVGENRVECQNGYLIEHDFRESDDSICFTTAYSKCVIQYPESPSQEEMSYISDYVIRAAESIQNAAFSSDYTEYIDLDSFAKMYIINEIVNNPDANSLSTYYYKPDNTQESKLYAGPAWDYDLALGNEPRGEDVMCSTFGEGLYAQLYQSAEFKEALERVFVETVEEVGGKYCTEYFDKTREYMKAAYAMNEVRWKEKEGYSAAVYSGFEESIGYVEYYFTQRFQRYQNAVLKPEQYHKVSFVRGGDCYAHMYVGNGETVPEATLQGLSSLYSRGEWYLKETGDIDIATYRIFGDTELKSLGLNDEGSDLEQTDDRQTQEPDAVDSIISRGELAMQWISFIMLMIPGLLALWISGNLNSIRKDRIALIIAQYFINTLLILVMAYGIFYVMYGNVILSFSGIYDESYDYSIFNTNVAFKYLALSCILAVGLGIVERLYCTIKQRIAADRGENIG